jgi:hypothetical protein
VNVGVPRSVVAGLCNVTGTPPRYQDTYPEQVGDRRNKTLPKLRVVLNKPFSVMIGLMKKYKIISIYNL